MSGLSVQIAIRKDLENNGLFGIKSKCCQKQVVVCGINDRANNCEDEICDELMCLKCKDHVHPTALS